MSPKTRKRMDRVHLQSAILSRLIAAILFFLPNVSRAEHQPAPACPTSVFHWTEQCAAATSTRITAESCPDHRVILAAARGLSGPLRIEITPNSKGFRQVRGFSLSPIGSFSDWNAAPEHMRTAFDHVVQCAERDSRIDTALTDMRTTAPAADRVTEYARFMTSPQSAWLWFFLFAFVALALKSIIQQRTRALAFVLVGGAAFAARISSPHHPANWYSDVWGPRAAVSEVFVRRGGGYAGFFQMIHEWFSIQPAHIFAFSALCSSLAVALVIDVQLAEFKKGGQRPAALVPMFSAALLALDPRMRYLGASDAAHNVAVFSFALMLWFYRDAIRRAPRSAYVFGAGLVILILSFLTGMTRPELLGAVVVLPLLGMLYAPAKPKSHLLPLVCALVGATVVVIAWAGRPLGVALEPITIPQCWRWLRGSTPPLLWFPWCLLTIYALRRRSLAPLLPILAYYVAAAPRIPTGYAWGTYRGNLNEVTAAVRYDAISHVILLLSIAHGLATLGHLDKLVDKVSAKRAIRMAVCMGGFVFCMEWSAFTTGGAHRFPKEPSSFQLEYDFLARALPTLPQNSTVATVWNDHFPSRTADPDAGMAWPASLLSYLRPDLKFITIHPGSATVIPQGSYVFWGAMCNFDPEALGAFVPPEDVTYARQFVAVCHDLIEKTNPIPAVADAQHNVVDPRFVHRRLVFQMRQLARDHSAQQR